jgi:polysaccharide export outer membrane protein
LIGNVEIGGMELTAAEAAIRDASVEREIYRNPQVSVAVQKRRSNKVTVLGAVNREGTYELPSNQSDLLAALVAAGGLAKDADTVIEIRAPQSPIAGARGVAEVEDASSVEEPPGRVTLANLGEDEAPQAALPPAPPAEMPASVRINLASSNLQSVSHDVADGGVVMVMRRPKQMVQVIGLVKRPGQFEVPADQDVRLLDAVALAGGLTTEMADKVIVVRQQAGGADSIMIRASLDKAKREHLENFRLAAGDVVSVEETALTFTMTELQKYIRFTVSAASRLTLF